MLLDPRVVEAVEQNMANNKAASTAPPSPAPRPPSAAFSEQLKGEDGASIAAEMAGNLPIMMYGSGALNTTTAVAVEGGEAAEGKTATAAAAGENRKRRSSEIGRGGAGGGAHSPSVWYGRLAEDPRQQAAERFEYAAEHAGIGPSSSDVAGQHPQGAGGDENAAWAGFDAGDVEGSSGWGPSGTAQVESNGAGDGTTADVPPELNNDQYDQASYDQQYAQQYDQYGQYHTTDQYHVDTTLGDPNGAAAHTTHTHTLPAEHDMVNTATTAIDTLGGADAYGEPPMDSYSSSMLPHAAEDDTSDPTLGQVLGSFLRPVSSQEGAGSAIAGAGHLMESVGGTLKGFFSEVAAAAAAAGQGDMYDDTMATTSESQQYYQQQQQHEDGQYYPSSEVGTQQWKQEHDYENENGNGNDGEITAFHTPEKSTRPQYNESHIDQMPPTPGDLGLFSPGQLAADLGVPRNAVTMSALFDAEGGSVGTLSSQNSIQDGWSDGGGDLPLGLPLEESRESGEIAHSVGGDKTSQEGEINQGELLLLSGANITTTGGGGGEEILTTVSAVVETTAAVVDGGGGDGWDNDGFDIDLPSLAMDNKGTAVVPSTAAVVEEESIHIASFGGVEEESIPVVAANEEYGVPQPYFPTDNLSFATATQGSGDHQRGAQEEAPAISATTNEFVFSSDALAELNALKLQLQESQAATRAAQNELESAREEAAVHATTLAEALGTRDALSRENSELLQELNALRGDVVALNQFEERCANLEHEVEVKTAAAEGAQAEAAALQTERNTLLAKIASLESVGDQKAGAEAAAAAAAGELAVLHTEIDGLKEALDSRDNEIDDLKSALELKDDAITQLKLQEARANEEKAIAEAAVSARDAQLVGLRNELSAAQEAITRAEEDASDRVASALQDVRDKMQTALAEAISEKDSELAKLEAALREEMAAQAAQLAAAEDELCTTVDEKDGEIMQLEARAITAEQEASETKAALEAATAAAATHQSELEVAQTRAKDMERKFAIARKKIAAQQAQHEALATEAAALKVQVESGTAGRDAELAQMAAALEAAAQEQQRLMNEAATLQARLIAAEESSQTSNSGREQEFEEMAVALESAYAAQETLANEATALQSRVDELSAAKDAEIHALTASHERQIAAMSAALENASNAQQDLSVEANALQARLDELNASSDAEMQSLVADRTQLIDMLAHRDATLEAMSLEIETLRETAASAGETHANAAQLAAELTAAREQIAQWTSLAEDTNSRYNAAEEALAAERAAREEAANAAAMMQQELASLQGVLAATEAQLNEVAAMQDVAGHEEVEMLRQQLDEMDAELAAARAAIQSFNRGEFEDAVEEVEELKSQLSVASQVATAKEEELRKYKLQLVKAKKVRAADGDKITALEEAKAAAEAAVVEAQARAATAEAAAAAAVVVAPPAPLLVAPPAPSAASAEELASLREEINALQEQMDALRAASAESDEGLNEALSALGAEEAKVARLAEMLAEKGVPENVVEEELAAIEEMMVLMEDEEAENAEESLC